MGVSYYMKVIGKCDIKDFIIGYKTHLLNSKDPTWIQRIPKINVSKFLKNVEINFENFEFTIIYEDLIKEYAELLFYDFILQAIKDKTLSTFYNLFDDSGNISLNSNDTVKINIATESSYKGSEKLNINFLQINQYITKVKNICPKINIYTKLGES
jgi:hypothetical protein